jgi:SAM-dependent methyltransferase
LAAAPDRIAYSLINTLHHGHYTGLDIDPVSVTACRKDPAFIGAGCTFVHADLDSEVYNEGGKGTAAAYELPFEDANLDVVYLKSVFTHLTDEECANYAQEIVRVLKPSGRAVVSGFLRDLGTGESVFTFKHRVGDVWVEYADNPRKAVAADISTFDRWFGRTHTKRLRGGWRGDAGEHPNGQDWLFYAR